MKRMVLGLASILAAGIGFAAFAAASPQTSMSEVEMLIPKQKPMTQLFYSDGTNMRMEMSEGTGAGKVLKTTSIFKGDIMYMLDPVNKTAMKMIVKPAQGQKKEESPKCDKWEDCIKAGNPNTTVTNRGKEKWEGQEYTVYRVTDNKTKDYLDYYVDAKGMVKRWVSYDAKGNLLADTRMLKFEVGKPLPAGIFDIPAGYQVIDMSKMPGMGGGSKP